LIWLSPFDAAAPIFDSGGACPRTSLHFGMMAFVTTNKSLILKIKQQRAIRRLISFKKVPPGQNPRMSFIDFV
jgi:hypothetical protein